MSEDNNLAVTTMRQARRAHRSRRKANPNDTRSFRAWARDEYDDRLLTSLLWKLNRVCAGPWVSP